MTTATPIFKTFIEKSSLHFLASDLHWDNPKCDRGKLKEDLQEAKRRGAKIYFNGDIFCLMQGKGDRRKAKSDIRPEHNNNRYLDSVVHTACEWFEPFKDNIAFVAYGNHETSIIKHQETDVLGNFVHLMNVNGANIHLGEYSGWIVLQYNGTNRQNSFKIKYHHGFGGGGAVTKGAIQHNRMATYIADADVIWMGHVHEEYVLKYKSEKLTANHKRVLHKTIHMLRTPTYKEEYGEGAGGYHIECGRPPKPLGGVFMHLECERKTTDKTDSLCFKRWFEFSDKY